jgi:hypothetical protein
MARTPARCPLFFWSPVVCVNRYMPGVPHPLNLQKFFGCLPVRREAEEWLRKAEE